MFWMPKNVVEYNSKRKPEGRDFIILGFLFIF
jgi:hypothetical protein